MNETKFNPGPIILMGSGETSAGGGAVFEKLVRKYPSPVHIAILETPAGFELNSDRVAGRVGDFLATRLQNYSPLIDIIPARKKGDYFGPDTEEILEPLYSADIIFLGPGSPTYAARQLQGSLAYEIIQAKQRTGAALVLASAATLAFGSQTMPVYEIFKAGMDLHWQTGLDFFRFYGLDLIIVPHWNNTQGGAELDTSHCFIGKDRFEALIGTLNRPADILGIDEHTFTWIDPVEGTLLVSGTGQVHLEAKGQSRSYGKGESVAFLSPRDQVSQIHAFQGIRDSVKDRLIFSQKISPKDEVSIPQEILALVDEREQARKNSNYSQADALRARIMSLGWIIEDSGNGPVIKPGK